MGQVGTPVEQDEQKPEKAISNKAKIDQFFKERGEDVHLQDVLNHFSPGRKSDIVSFPYEKREKELILHLLEEACTFQLFCEKRTGYEFVVGYFSRDVLYADREVNPRPLIKARLQKATDAFLKGETRFQFSIGRLLPQPGGRVALAIFDGSHGAAAELFAGSDTIFCKLYLDINRDNVLQWNIHAHSELRQQEFRGQVLAAKRSEALDNRWEEFERDERFPIKSEREFVHKFISPLDRKNMQAAITDQVINYVLYSKQTIETADGRTQEIDLCRMVDYIELSPQSRRSKDKLSFNQISSTIFSDFISRDLCDFDESKGKSEDNPREREKRNLLQLCNLLAIHTLENKWKATEDGQKNGRATPQALIAERLWKKGALRYWSPILKEAIGLIIGVAGRDAERIFQFNINSATWNDIEACIKRLFEYPGWRDEQLVEVLNTNVLEGIERAFADWTHENNQHMLDAYYLAAKQRPGL